jgi:MFS family permease
LLSIESHAFAHASLYSIRSAAWTQVTHQPYPAEYYCPRWQQYALSLYYIFIYLYTVLVGVYATAPFWGRIADHRGPRILLAIGFVGLLVGYSGIRWAYDAGLPTIKNPQGETITGSLPSSHLYLLILCGFLSGAGGNGGLVASVNTTAKSFPDSAVCTLAKYWSHILTKNGKRCSVHRQLGWSYPGSVSPRSCSPLSRMLSSLETHPIFFCSLPSVLPYP